MKIAFWKSLPFWEATSAWKPSNYNRAYDVADWQPTPTTADVVVAKIAGYVRVRILMNRWIFFVFLAIIVFTLRPLCWIYEYKASNELMQLTVVVGADWTLHLCMPLEGLCQWLPARVPLRVWTLNPTVYNQNYDVLCVLRGKFMWNFYLFKSNRP